MVRKDAPRYRLKLEKLDFISAVDEPAQSTAKVLLIKRGPAADRVEAFARVAKVDDELGLVFCWAFTSTTADGADHFDLQNDCIDQDFVKAAADFMQGGGAVDEMHDGAQTGRVVFCMPMTPEIAKVYGVATDTVGLMVALKPSTEALAKFKSGEYTGVSIAGLGTRSAVDKAKKATCASCGSFAALDAKKCPSCGNSMAKRAPSTISKAVMLTTDVLGHCHLLDDGGSDDPSPAGYTTNDTMQPTPGVDSYGLYHSHPWSRSNDGTVVIGAALGHTHELLTKDDLDDAIAAVDDTADAIALKRKETAMAMTDAEKSQLTKALALAEMTDAQKSYHATLDESGQSAFRALGRSGRDLEVAKAREADPVVVVLDGVEYRKSAGEQALKLAKLAKSQAESLEKRDSELANERLEKRARTEMSNLAGTVDDHIELLKMIDAHPDAASRERMTAVIRSAQGTASLGLKRLGVNGDSVAKDAHGKFDAVVKRIRAANPQLTEPQAIDKAMDDKEGRAAYLEIEAAKRNPTATGRLAQHGA